MSAELDELLREASREPATPLDADALWAAGRRRRRRRQLGTVATGAVAVAIVAAVSLSLATPGTPVIEPVGPPPDEEPEPPAEDVVEDATDDAAPAPSATEPTAGDGEGSDMDVTESDEPADDTTREDPTPEPDSAAVADPCAAHAGREAEAFIAVVAPVAGQHIDGPIELVGCSNVYEATVRYRVVDADGSIVTDSFTTAECGTGCVGEFRDHIMAEPGDVTLQVFWDSPADGSEQNLVEIDLVMQ